MVGLRRFGEGEIYLSQHEAWTLLKFFWPYLRLTEKELTPSDINFAQGLLVEAIDASYKMGYVHIVYDTFYAKVPGSLAGVKSLIKSFAKKAARHWFKHVTARTNFDDVEIYDAVRGQLAVNFKSIVEIRQATGDLTY
jgi:hypothetical protein